MDAKPHLTIQMVTWNSAEDLSEALPVLATFPIDQVTIRVIDNGSTDESVALVAQQLPQADVIELPENRGFAGGHNVGFARCQTEFVMVYNTDLQASWEGIQEVLKAFADAKVGSAQGLLLRPTNDETHTPSPSPLSGRGESAELIDSAGVAMTWALNGVEIGAGEVNTGQYATEADVVACTGAAAMYRLRALREVAHPANEIFDEDFFAYKEDVDLGWRLRRAGWRNRYVPVTQGIHRRAMRSDIPIWKRMSDPRTRYSFRNWIWMIYKNATLKELLRHEIFIDARLFVFVLLTLWHPSFFKVWLETFRGLPKMIAKRDA